MTITSPLPAIGTALPPASRAERLLLPATFVTSLGNGIQLVAAAVLVFTTGQSALAVGWLFIAVSVPPALLSLWFGTVADRFDRRTLCLIADLASAAAALVLPVWILTGRDPGPVAYATAFALSLLAALFMPASNALIKERVHPARVARFSSHYEMALQLGTLLAASIGGFLIHFVGTTPLFMFNAVTFLASAAALYALRSAPAVRETATAATAATGAAAAPLVRYGLLYALCQVMTMVSNTTLIVLVYEGFGRGAGVYGLVDALAGVGFCIAAACYPLVSGRFGHLRTAVAGGVGCALVSFLLPIHLAALLVCVPPAAFLVGLSRVAMRTLLLESVPEQRAGRLFGAVNAAGLGLSAAMTILVAYVADASHVRYGFYVLGAACAVATIAVAITLRGKGSVTSAAPPPPVPATG
ncbi:MFS transporter [Glycomyces harbinensis]|uniref:Major Facilitator Superfamily protein n=1 Tax=Glycomyces harbinensis TaxID=58114 RepID=A0A1G7DNL2_9ACTN|nr:MFS transporter [Glycomyces harbinensis]SDE53144.1 Major Facilitator Superfamily protein [Glycomyces harbinensis]